MKHAIVLLGTAALATALSQAMSANRGGTEQLATLASREMPEKQANQLAEVVPPEQEANDEATADGTPEKPSLDPKAIGEVVLKEINDKSMANQEGKQKLVDSINECKVEFVGGYLLGQKEVPVGFTCPTINALEPEGFAKQPPVKADAASIGQKFLDLINTTQATEKEKERLQAAAMKCVMRGMRGVGAESPPGGRGQPGSNYLQCRA